MIASQVRFFWVCCMLLFLAVILAWYGMDFSTSPAGGDYQQAMTDSDCDLHNGPCFATLQSGETIQFEISPFPIKPLTDLQLTVSSEKLKIEAVKVDFKGIGVDMGFYRPELASTGEGRFIGSAKLSVCTLDRMLWQASVIVKTPQGVVIAPFRFEVEQ